MRNEIRAYKSRNIKWNDATMLELLNPESCDVGLQTHMDDIYEGVQPA